jgi:hypothetical protein
MGLWDIDWFMGRIRGFDHETDSYNGHIGFAGYFLGSDGRLW